jgi:probable DNA metabolism protein
VISSDMSNLDLKIDPKLSLAIRNPARFPIDINAADRGTILKVPGIGLKSANRIVNLRRKGRIRFEHLKQMGVVIPRAQPFIRCDGLPTKQWQVASPTQEFPAAKYQRDVKDPSVQHKRLVFLIDGTFEGLLTAILESYAGKRPPDTVDSIGQEQLGLFERHVKIQTDAVKADRVWKGLKSHLGSKRRRMIFEAFLSGRQGAESMIYRFVRDTVPHRSGKKIEAHLQSHIEIEKLSQKVRREAHRMKGFIRFHQTGQNQFLALIAPQYDVLPLVRRHFEHRFADQGWIIYDKLRNYGLCYDRNATRELRLDAAELKASYIDDDAEEQMCQTLWQRYYAAVNIPQRKNPKLHLRQLPRRFWRYLPEKKQ